MRLLIVAEAAALHRRSVLKGLGGSAAACLVTACGSLLSAPKPPPPLYVLAPMMPGPMAGMRVKWQLSVALPNAQASLNTPRIALSMTPTMLDYYADAAWTDRLPLLVQDLLIESFEHSGKITGVARDTAGIAANYRLDTEMRQFEAHYDQADTAPRVVVRLEAKLASLPDRNIVDSLSVNHEAQAAKNDLNSIVTAFNEASGAALQEIVNWTLRALPSG